MAQGRDAHGEPQVFAYIRDACKTGRDGMLFSLPTSLHRLCPLTCVERMAVQFTEDCGGKSMVSVIRACEDRGDLQLECIKSTQKRQFRRA